ncbi:MAG: FecR family protein [Spirochaetaceae bacterium]|nr:FecR family protein [Spirochaetaceae bacterium]
MKKTARQEDKEHNRILDTLVIILCLFFATFFVYRFWADLNQRMVKAGEQPVGTITFKKKAAQRRFIDRVLWDRLQRESPVYNGDVIRTAEISEASVTFSSGGQVINLNENSLVQIFADENGPRIDFTEGGISVDSARGGVALVSGGKTINVGEGGVISAGTGNDGAFSLAVAAGNVRLVDEDGTTQVAQAGSGVFYNPDGTVATGPRALVYAPKPDMKIVAGENAPPSSSRVEFLWNNTNYQAGMTTRIECAADRNFRRITYAEDVAATERAALQVPAGTTYWRAYPVSQNGEDYVSNASTGKVSVIYAPPPRLVAPLPGETITFRNIRPSVRYEWSGTDDPLSFRLVIADNPALASPVVTTNVPGTAQVTSELGEGTWYWRVEPVFPQDVSGTPAVSEVSSFTIVRMPGTIPEPQLMLPSPGNIISIAPRGPDTYFSWKGDAEAVSFRFIVSRNADLSSPVINTPVGNNYYTYTAKDALLQAGSYYWTVTQTDAEGLVSPEPAARLFQASFFAEDVKPLPAPVVVTPVEGSRVSLAQTPVAFSWRPVSGADNYAFRLYRTNGGNTLVHETNTAGALSVSVPVTPGNYTWTVQAMGTTKNEGLERAGNSVEQRFVARNVAHVNLVSPARDATITGRNALRSGMSAIWTTTESLRASRFILSRNPDPLQGTPVMDARDPVSPLALPRLGEGTYYWTVLAEIEDNYPASARSPARFQVTAVVFEPVALVSPANGAQIPLAETRRAGLVQWTSAETPARSRFVLSRNPNPLSGTPILDIQNPPPMINLPALEPGDYYWTVTGTTSEGFSIGARSPSMFRVLPAPPLPAVRSLVPADGTAMQPEALRESRRVVFRWDAVEGANEYVFTLWKDGGARETLVASRPTNGTSVVFDDLNRLAEGGVFVWQVTARYRAENGRVEREGLDSESRFTIDIPRPSRGQAYPPGILYGR